MEKYNNFKVILGFEILIFTILLLFGVTGSSIGIFKNNGIINYNEEKIIGEYKSIRGDEWAVNTMLSIAQFNSHQKYPQKNINLGIEGKKLSIAHMTGIPVAELSLIGKPATWGFYIFNLKRALSWQWLFPIFIGINGVWFLLNILFKKQKFINFILSITLAFSPYSVVWSFWPIYIQGVGSIITACFLCLIKNNSIKHNILYSIILAISSISYVLFLYIAWIIPLTTCFLFIVIGYIIQNYNELNFKKIKINYVFLFLSLITILTVIFVWYSNNSDAIYEILNSTYPGKRRVYGGNFPLWNFIKGWLTPITINHNVNYSNQCELSSYINFIIPIFTILVYCKDYIKNKIVFLLIIFILICYIYQFLGFPKIIGDILLWNKTTETRCDIAIDMSQLILLSYLCNKSKIKINSKLSTYFSLSLPLFIIIFTIIMLPYELKNTFIIYKKSTIFIITSLFILYYIILNNIKIFPYFLLLVLCFFTILWNPICIAPNNINFIFNQDIKNNKNNRYNNRIAVATGSYPMANAIAASGYPVLNATSFYIDNSIYNIFYKNVDNGQYKKYNHMPILIDNNIENFQALAIGDQNIIKINIDNFDFKLFLSDYFITNYHIISKNKTLDFISKKNNYYLYKINYENYTNK